MSKNKGGRPPAVKSEDDMERKCEAFLKRMEEPDFVPTMHGLANELGMSRSTLYEYRNKVGFSDIIKGTVDKVTAWWEKRLAESACTGAIFWLKNHGWTDKTQTEISGGLDLRKETSDELRQRISRLLTDEALVESLGLSKENLGAAISTMAGQIGRLDHPI